MSSRSERAFEDIDDDQLFDEDGLEDDVDDEFNGQPDDDEDDEDEYLSPMIPGR